MQSFKSWRHLSPFIVAVGATSAMLAVACMAAAKDPTSWVAPPDASAVKNPVTADAASVARGKAVFAQQCEACHGRTGKGDGPVAADLSTPPADLANPKMWEQTDGALFWKITEGRSPMPAYKSLLAEKQRWDVVNFIRTLAPKPRKES